jgi:thiamine pyrophosphate-dependent acetolactate synthase large subunit-like protein
MGVGLPFAVGAKAAGPSAQVIRLHGDGSFGQNAIELHTSARHNPAATLPDRPQRLLDR